MEYSQFNSTAPGNLSTSNNQYITSPGSLKFTDILFIIIILAIMITVFVKCTFPGFLYLIGKGPKVNIICIILGFFWILNILALFIAFINAEQLDSLN